MKLDEQRQTMGMSLNVILLGWTVYRESPQGQTSQMHAAQPRMQI
jgi:hypothetical protein